MPADKTQLQLREEMQKRLLAKSERFARLFRTDVGKEVLQYLEQEFNQNDLFVPGDPHTTAYNLGRRDVVVYIRQLVTYKEKHNDLEERPAEGTAGSAGTQGRRRRSITR